MRRFWVPPQFRSGISGFSAASGARYTIRTCGQVPLPHDPSTWPKNWTPAQMKVHLSEYMKPGATPNYESFASLLSRGDAASLATLARHYMRQPPDNTIESLLREINNTAVSASMPLQERTRQLNAADRALSAAGGKRNIVCCSSQRGTGKTQFLKWLVHMRRAHAMECGRVIVRCCDVVGHNGTTFMHHLLEGRPDMAYCVLVRSHAERVTGKTQDPSKYCDPKTGYETWMSETATHFNIPSDTPNMQPIIMLDTCELLAGLRCSVTGKAHNLLEAFCLAAPPPCGIVAVGCDAHINVIDADTLITNIGPLPPLSKEGFREAMSKSWRVEVDEDRILLMNDWCCGVPRLLCLSQEIGTPGKIMSLHECFDHVRKRTQSQYPIAKKWFPHAFTCLLVASTKATMRGSDLIDVNPAWKHLVTDRQTYSDAATAVSIVNVDVSTNRVTVPPIAYAADRTGVDEEWSNMPIFPWQLHPLLDANVVKRFSLLTDVECMRLFEKAFLHAFYARYLLTHWKDITKQWVSLAAVLEGAVHHDLIPVLEQYEVNLSGGVIVDGQSNESVMGTAYAATFVTCKGSRGGAASIWGRRKSIDGTTTSTKTIMMTLQYKPLAIKIGDVNKAATIPINADGMCSVGWLQCRPMVVDEQRTQLAECQQ